MMTKAAAALVVAVVGVIVWLLHMDFTEYPEDFDFDSDPEEGS